LFFRLALKYSREKSQQKSVKSVEPDLSNRSRVAARTGAQINGRSALFGGKCHFGSRESATDLVSGLKAVQIRTRVSQSGD